MSKTEPVQSEKEKEEFNKYKKDKKNKNNQRRMNKQDKMSPNPEPDNQKNLDVVEKKESQEKEPLRIRVPDVNPEPNKLIFKKSIYYLL